MRRRGGGGGLGRAGTLGGKKQSPRAVGPGRGAPRVYGYFHRRSRKKHREIRRAVGKHDAGLVAYMVEPRDHPSPRTGSGLQGYRSITARRLNFTFHFTAPVTGRFLRSV